MKNFYFTHNKLKRCFYRNILNQITHRQIINEEIMRALKENIRTGRWQLIQLCCLFLIYGRYAAGDI